MDIILLGDPAAGKATQAAKLLKKYKLIDFDMGKELRRLDKTGSSKLRARFAKTLNKGKLTPTDIVRKILKDKIFSTPKTKGILFDGTPKMIGEAKLVRKWLKARSRDRVYVIYLSIPEKEIFKRMHDRLEYFKGKYSRREDDTPAAMHRRIKYFRTGIKEVLAFFEKNYQFKKISGMGDRAQVHAKIVEAINEFTDQDQRRH